MRVFEILDDIIEAVESAKGVPMSSSAIVNRPMLLDLLDDLRDAFPGTLEDAREILEQRDDIVESARTEAERVQQTSTSEARDRVESARSEADQTVSEATAAAQESMQRATDEAERVVSAARAEAESMTARARREAESVAARAQDDAARTVAAGTAERDRLVSEHEVYRTATASANALVDDAQRQAGKLRGDADKYVETNLSDLALTLQKLMGTVERGREKLHSRGGPGFGDSGSAGGSAAVADRGGFDAFDQNR